VLEIPQVVMTQLYDLAVIGGGINGCGIARDAAGRGHRTVLIEQGDLASATSSQSTKLIHGGLRYLEHYEFGLVRKALVEREKLWSIAPHIAWPLRFVLPHRKGMRPALLLRLGLWLYDHLGGRARLAATKTPWRRSYPLFDALDPHLGIGFEYSDLWVEDARLVVLNAMSARDHGADILTRHRVTAVYREGTQWRIEGISGEQSFTLRARCLVNAAGPWADQLSGVQDLLPKGAKLRLVRGSHIVVPRLYADERCFILQNDDGRIVFVIPYEQDFSLIGTTDVDHQGSPAHAQASGEEIRYLCTAVNRQFVTQITPQDVVWSYAGVRPLLDDGATAAQEATRDYKLVRSHHAEGPVVLSVIGGKLTTYRVLAEEVMDQLADVLEHKRGSFTASEALPGGDFPLTDFGALCARLAVEHPHLPQSLLRRAVRAYGTQAKAWLGPAQTLDDLGTCFGADLTQAEVDYLCRVEFAISAEDIVWRRSKLGLRMTRAEINLLEDYLARA
jgi:glycerol-3-phosphate dehydrogenase